MLAADAGGPDHRDPRRQPPLADRATAYTPTAPRDLVPASRHQSRLNRATLVNHGDFGSDVPDRQELRAAIPAMMHNAELVSGTGCGILTALVSTLSANGRPPLSITRREWGPDRSPDKSHSPPEMSTPLHDAIDELFTSDPTLQPVARASATPVSRDPPHRRSTYRGESP